jgi:UDP-N-acetylmuramoyl-L-alanyl-D-glutamate--2,6-diaminopimelate ligase
VVRITGTNGKTTTVHLLAAALEAAGRRTGQIGTLTGARTTPEAPELQATLARLRAEGCTAVAMEVSSHALAVHRADATWFSAVVFTNLSQDHLDFHGTMDAYFEAKASLFDADRAAVAIVDVDDVWGARLADRIEAAGDLPLVRCSLADLEDLEVGLAASRFTWRGQPVVVPLGGRHNAANALLAAEAAVAVGAEPVAVAAGLAGAGPVPGRFEPVDAGQDFDVLVDYAHTPDGLVKLLEGVRAATDGRVLVVFGCGGDRDREKRPLMGRAAAEGADLVVVTSDNPRGEDPQAIIEAVIDGIDDRQHVTVQPDRREAIALALRQARPGDVVVVAGKGHETTQTVGEQVLPFDDPAVARELLEGAA